MHLSSWSFRLCSISRKRRAGQVNIDYIGGFMLFVVSMIYITSSTIRIIPLYQDKIDNDNSHLEAWIISERLMSYLENENYVIDGRKIDDLNSINYNDLKKILLVDDNNNFMLDIYQYPVILTSNSDNSSTGIYAFGGVNVLFNITGNNSVEISGQSLGRGDSKTIAGRKYTIDAIDSKGRYVVLKTGISNKDVAKEIGKSTTQVVRYSTYEGFIAKIILVYF